MTFATPATRWSLYRRIVAGARWMTFVLLCTPLFAGSAPRQFDLPADAAEVSLRLFSTQSGQEVLFGTETAKGVTTSAVHGTYVPLDALKAMLVGTGLIAGQDEASGVIIVKPINTASPMKLTPLAKVRRVVLSALLFFFSHNSQAQDASPDAVKDTSGKPKTVAAPDSSSPATAADKAAAPAAVVKLSPFEVKAGPEGYEAVSSASGTRLDTPLADLSKNILVLTRTLIEDQGTNDLNAAMAFAASVAPSGPDQGQGLSVRGFGGNSPKRNGLGIYGSDESIYDTATMDRIEVVKGPAALLYGVSSPGGLVNYITKQPLPTEHTSLRLLAGSWDNYRFEFDTGGPLLGDGHTLNHRLIIAGDQGKSFAKYGQETRGLISEDLRWFISDNTYITFGGEYNMRNSNAIRTLDNAGITWRATFNPDGTLKQPYASVDVNNREYLGITPYTTEDTVVKRVDLDVAHKFTDTLNFFVHYNYISNNLQNMGEFFQLAEGVGTGVGPNEATEYLYYRLPHRSSQNVTVSLSDTFENDWAKMEVVAGAEFFHYFLSFEQDAPATFPKVNFVTGAGYETPQPNTIDQVYAAIAAGTWVNQFRYFEHQDYASPYLITHTHLLHDRLRIILGIRHDAIRDGQTFYANAGDPAHPFAFAAPSMASYYTKATSPLVGISFNPIDSYRALSLYYSYSESLQPNEVVDQSTGKGLGPQTGKGNEVGLKLDLKGKIFAQLGLFQIDKTGVPEGVPGYNPPKTILGGLQRSKGADLDITYTAMPGWQTMLGLSYVDATYMTDADPGNIGQQLAGIPKFRGTIWTKYVIQDGTYKGLSFGGGVIRSTGTNNGYAYPGLATAGWTRVDLICGYMMKAGQHGRVDYELRVANVLDEKYAFNPSTLGAPRSYQAAVKYSY